MPVGQRGVSNCGPPLDHPRLDRDFRLASVLSHTPRGSGRGLLRARDVTALESGKCFDTRGRNVSRGALAGRVLRRVLCHSAPALPLLADRRLRLGGCRFVRSGFACIRICRGAVRTDDVMSSSRCQKVCKVRLRMLIHPTKLSPKKPARRTRPAEVLGWRTARDA